MNDTQKTIEKISSVLSETETLLTKWDWSNKLQVPALMTQLAVALNWDEKTTRMHDPIIRLHLKDHELYVIDRGAQGGIALKASKKQKEDKIKEKSKIKAELKAKIEKEITSEFSSDESSEINIDE